MKFRKTSNFLVSAVALCMLLDVSGYFCWTVFSDQPDALQAKLHPFLFMKAISYQLSRSSSPTDWNIPARSIAVWLAWLFGIFACGTVSGLGRSTKSQAGGAAGTAVIAFATGFVLFSMIQLLLGLAGITTPVVLWLFGAAGFVSLANCKVRNELLRLPHGAVRFWRDLNAPARAGAVVLAGAFLLLVVPALTPPVQSDGMRYHLGAVQEYLKHGAIVYLPHNAYSNMPFFVEMHFMAALACRAPEATQLMHLTLAFFTVLAIYAVICHLSPGTSPEKQAPLALLTAAVYLATPMSGILATWPFTDHGISFFLMASILSALVCSGSREASATDLVVLAVCAGGLIGTKYTMAPVALAVALIPWTVRYRLPKTMDERAPSKDPVLSVCVAVIIMAAVGGVWYLKNLIFTENPFYPLGSHWFPGGDWGTANDQFLHLKAGAKGVGHGVTDFLLSPWNATFRWLAFEGHNPGASLIIAPLAAILALMPSRSIQIARQRQMVFAVAVISFIIWFFTYQSNRLLLPVLAVCLSLSPVEFFGRIPLTRRLYISALSVASTLGLAWAIQWSFVATALSPPPVPYLLGAQDGKTFRYQSLTYARTFDYLNTKVKPNERVLLIGEHRIYGASFSALWSDWFDTPVLATLLRESHLRSVQQLLQYLRSQNINWIVINEQELAPQMESAFRPWFSDNEWNIFLELRNPAIPGIDVIHLPPGATILHLTGQGK